MKSLKGDRACNINDYRINNAKNSNKKRFPNSSFYILQIQKTNYYKLGVSQHINRRHRDIESVMPFKVDIILVIKIEDAYDFEFKVHQSFKEKYIKSEWFVLTTDDLELINKLLVEWQDQRSGQKIEKARQLRLY